LHLRGETLEQATDQRRTGPRRLERLGISRRGEGRRQNALCCLDVARCGPPPTGPPLCPLCLARALLDPISDRLLVDADLPRDVPKRDALAQPFGDRRDLARGHLAWSSHDSRVGSCRFVAELR